MDPLTVAIIVIILGLILLAIEATSPGGYLLIPGAVLVVIGGYGCAAPDNFYTWWTPAVAIVACIPVTVATFWLYKKLGDPEPPSTTVAGSLVGKTGTVVVEVTPDNMKGKVRIGSDTWSAVADEVIPVGTSVTVDQSEGVHVHVVRS